MLGTLSSLGGHRKGEPFATSSSSGTAFDDGWRQWWRQQSKIDGTGWESLLRQHIRALRALRGLGESSGAVP